MTEVEGNKEVALYQERAEKWEMEWADTESEAISGWIRFSLELL